MRKKREILEEAPINLTPLIDVVFVILIMFIVIAPLIEIERVELANGLCGKEATKGDSSLVIHVHADDTISFNKRPITLKELKNLLITLHERYPAGRPQLFHDKRATFGTYQTIKNAIEAAGFCEMDVVLKPE